MKRLLIVLLAVAMLLSLSACGGSAEPEAPEETADPVMADLTPGEEAAFAVADAVAEELEALFPEEYREDYTFGVQVDPHRDGGLIVSLTVDQESDDTGTAFAMALEYYEKAVNVAQQHGETVVDYSIMVDNKGAPVGWYRTSDGVTYTDTISGEQLEAPAP